LLVEERRIVVSITGNENLEIQWRLATLNEAKAVVAQYHKYLSENSLIRSVFDETVSLPPPKKMKNVQDGTAAQTDLSVVDIRGHPST
jgi:sorbitol-specific phosphotransferase system component IIBC